MLLTGEFWVNRKGDISMNTLITNVLQSLDVCYKWAIIKVAVGRAASGGPFIEMTWLHFLERV